MTLIKGKICPPLPLFCILLILFSLRVLPGLTYDPEFDFPLPNLTAKLGTDVSFTCVVKHLGEYKVAWIKSDDKAILAWHTHMVTHNHRYVVTHNGHNSWTLHIKNVQQNDSGTYMVQINTDPMRMQIGTLEVVVPADIIDEETSYDVSVLENRTTILKCKATGYPTPKVRWVRKDNKTLPLSKELLNPGEKLVTWEGETLPLRNLERKDTDEYFCIANNSVPPQVSKRVMVYVHFPPMIIMPHNGIAAPAESNVTLECDVEALPKPLTSWSIKEVGQPILTAEGKYLVSTETVNDYTMRSKLTIFNLRPQDFADYNCSATNSLGGAEAMIKLQQIFPVLPKTTTTTTTHRPFKHAKDHDRLESKHTKFREKKPNNAHNGHKQKQQSGRSNGHPIDFSGEDSDNDLTQRATTMMSNPHNNYHSNGNAANPWRTTPTPTPPWSWGGSSGSKTRGRNAGEIYLCLPQLVFIPPMAIVLHLQFWRYF